MMTRSFSMPPLKPQESIPLPRVPIRRYGTSWFISFTYMMRQHAPAWYQWSRLPLPEASSFAFSRAFFTVVTMWLTFAPIRLTMRPAVLLNLQAAYVNHSQHL